MTILSAHALFHAYRNKPVLDGFSLELEPGTTTVLLGSNGAGKSTLMQLCLGVLRPRAGSIRVFGLDPWKQALQVRQRIGFVPSVPDAYGWMRIADLCRFLKPMYPSWRSDRAESLIERLGVPRGTRFDEMSRGEGMKAMLVAALAPDPELLLDEPFAGLDPLVREELLGSVLAELCEERPRTLLCTTHDLKVMARIADHVALLEQGRCVAQGPLEEILGEEEPARIPARLVEVLREAGTRDSEAEVLEC